MRLCIVTRLMTNLRSWSLTICGPRNGEPSKCELNRELNRNVVVFRSKNIFFQFSPYNICIAKATPNNIASIFSLVYLTRLEEESRFLIANNSLCHWNKLILENNLSRLLISNSRRYQVTCFRLYPSRLSRPLSRRYSSAKETKLVIGWTLLSLGRPNPKISRLLGKWRHAFFENVKYQISTCKQRLTLGVGSLANSIAIA